VPHLLIIEDDDEIRARLLKALRDLGHVVDTAPAGLPGLERALSARPELVILDLGLPDVDGTQVLAMLRAVSDVPVIIASACDDDPSLVQALDVAPTTISSSRSPPPSSTPASGRCCGAAAPGRSSRGWSSADWRSTRAAGVPPSTAARSS